MNLYRRINLCRLFFPFHKLIRPIPGYSGRNLFPGQLFRHDETSLRSQARQFASKLATALPSRTVIRRDGSQRLYCKPSLPSGSVTVTAAPLRATTWRPPAENGRGSATLATIPTTLVLRYKYGGGGKLTLFTPTVPSSSSAPLPLALHRRTEEQRRSTAAVLFHAGADARRRPTFPSTTPPPPLLFTTLLGDRFILCTLAAAPLPPAKLW
jgi:hypothetical protein